MSTQVKNTAKKSFLLRLLIIAFCVYLVFSFGSLIAELSAAQDTLAQQQAQIEDTKARTDDKKHFLENSTEKEIIEQAARDRLGMGYQDEKVFVNVTD